MIKHLKHLWRSIRSGKPGSRFRQHYEKTREGGHSKMHRGLHIGLGVLLMVAGVILSIPPAVPGFLVVIVGAAIVSSHSQTAARLFDRAERYARRIMAKVLRKKSSSKT